MRTSSPFLIDLALLVDGRPFDGMVAGEFTDMLGRTIRFAREDLSLFVANTMRNIEATRTESGEVVGLPIDSKNHDRGLAAGFIVAVELAGDIIRFIPKWTELGRDLITKGLMRFFSPTVDPERKVIVGGSLTNWPASRGENQETLLRPIELSMGTGLSSFESGPERRTQMEFTQEQLDQLRELMSGIVDERVAELSVPAGSDAPDVSELIESGAGAAELQAAFDAQVASLTARLAEDADRRAQLAIANYRRETRVRDLAQSWTGEENALPVQYDQLETFMLSLDETQLAFLETFVGIIRERGLVDFAELGQSRRNPVREELPAEYAAMIRSGRMKVSDLSDPVLALGDLNQYDLTPFQNGSE